LRESAGCGVLFAWVYFRRKGSCDVRADKEYFGCFKVKIEKLRLKRKHNHRSTEVFPIQAQDFSIL